MHTTGIPSLISCATCLLDGGGTAQQATNLGIFVMLGVMAVVFGGIGAVFFSFARRKARLGAAAPDSAQAQPLFSN